MISPLRLVVRVAEPEMFADIRALRVRPDQERFVDQPAVLLEGLALFPGAEVLAVLADERVVGVMWCQRLAEHEPVFLIWDFLIDAAQQRRGLGRAALLEVIELLRSRGARRIRLAYVPGNEAARRLYRSAGFVDTGRQTRDGEVEMQLELE